MPVQDDKREEFVRQLLGLVKPEGSGRAGIDAELILPDGRKVAFELKSATRGDVTTVRDFGPDHIRKWKGKHWLIGFFDSEGKHLTSCVYVSPKRMEPWIREKEEYIRLDLELAQLAQKVDRRLFDDIVVRTFGDKAVYSLEDGVRIQKRQYTVAEYRRRMDCPNGYSRSKMVEMIADRWVYLTKRGSTLNNPHISARYFDGWDRLPLNPIKLVLPVEEEARQKAKQARDVLIRDVIQAIAEAIAE